MSSQSNRIDFGKHISPCNIDKKEVTHKISIQTFKASNMSKPMARRTGFFQKPKEINLFNVKFHNVIIFVENNRFFIMLATKNYFFCNQKRFQSYFANNDMLLFLKCNFFENYCYNFTFLLFSFVLIFLIYIVLQHPTTT